MIFVGLISTIVGLLFLTNGYSILGFPFIGYGGWVMWKAIFGGNHKLVRQAKSEWVTLISGTNYNHSESNSAIAINTEKKLISFKNKAEIKSYPFSDIRSWRYNLSSGGEVYGKGMDVIGHNIRNNRANAAASGFFVTVKDIDNPEWRIAMSSEKSMKKWMEIFEQHVNEN